MSNASNAKKSSYNIITDVIGKLLTITISIFVPKLYIENYGSDFNGLLNSINGIFVYLNLLEAGIGSASIQALYKPITQKNYDSINRILSATKYYYLRNGLIFLVGLIAISLSYPSFIHSKIDYWIVVILVVLGGAPYIVKFFFQGKYTVLLTADNRLYVLNIITNAIHVAANLVKVILLVNKVNIILVQGVFACLYLVQVVVIYAYVKKKYKNVSYSANPDNAALSKSKFAMVHEFAYVVFNNTDVLLLTFFCNLETVSIYSVYNMIFSQVTLMLQSITTGCNSGLGQLMAIDQNRYREVYENFEYTFQCFACFVIISVGIMSTPFVRLYTINAADANYLVPGLAFLFSEIQIFSLLRWPGVGAIKAAGMFKETQNRAIIEVAINLIASIVFIQEFEIYGVLFGTILALAYRTFDIILFTRKYVLLTEKRRAILRIIALIIISSFLLCLESRIDIMCDSYHNFFVKGCGIFTLNIMLFILFSMITNLKGISSVFQFVKKRVLN